LGIDNPNIYYATKSKHIRDTNPQKLTYKDVGTCNNAFYQIHIPFIPPSGQPYAATEITLHK